MLNEVRTSKNKLVGILDDIEKTLIRRDGKNIISISIPKEGLKIETVFNNQTETIHILQESYIIIK
jgi:hypothetical protein